jgi:tRNA threonylcarbamoyladenosine biosynthesis protein TsaB
MGKLTGTDEILLLGIDTCGPAGSVALARLTGGSIEILGETPIEGRSYSEMLIAAIGDLLKAHGLALDSIACLVAVSGPGSFTGVRIGLAAAKGLAEGADLKIVAVSRLDVLAHKSGVSNAALDAHRHEIFLRVNGRELLAGAADLAAIQPPPDRVALCDDAAADLLAKAWPATELVRVAAPAASDAIELAVPLIRGSEFADPVLLDGHYLRRSDAEIFGDPSARR